MLGEDSDFPLRDLEAILTALESLDEGPTIYARACEEVGIKPVYHPFWEGLPYTNIFQAPALSGRRQASHLVVERMLR
jgi:hypothetical protein